MVEQEFELASYVIGYYDLWLQEEHLEANDESKIGNTDGARQFKSETLVRYII